jgi:hypothetical protein
LGHPCVRHDPGGGAAFDWTTRHYWLAILDFGGIGVHVRRIDADTGAIDGVDLPLWPQNGVTIDPATRRVYFGVYDGSTTFDVRAFDADTLTGSSLGAQPLFVSGVNPSTSKLYQIGLPPLQSVGVYEFDEPVAAAVPMPTTVMPGAPDADGDVTVGLEATSHWTPMNHPVRRIFYQVDSTDGAWTAAAPAGPSASAALTGLTPGTHTVHAFATDGQETQLADANPLLVGPIASGSVTIPSPLSCDVAMSSATYANGDPVVITSLRFANASATPQPTRLRLQLTLPFGITANALDLGAGGGFAIPGSFDHQLGPVTMFTLQPGQPRGDFTWRCALEDPVTGSVQAEDRATFTFQ